MKEGTEQTFQDVLDRLKDLDAEELQIHNAACVLLNSPNYRVSVQLFKKAQIGSVREITILNYAARICTFVVEQVSRTKAGFDSSEAMTSGAENEEGSID
jgi:hypothetical protein